MTDQSIKAIAARLKNDYVDTDRGLCITDLADYNRGHLRFTWLYPDDFNDLEEFLGAINEFLTSPFPDCDGKPSWVHEEWFVSDYEGFPDLGEYPNLDLVYEFVDSNNDMEVLKAYYDDGNTLDGFDDAFCGVYESEKDYAEQEVEEYFTHQFKEFFESELSRHFDYESYAREIFMNSYWSGRVSEGVAVFRRI